MDFSKLMDKFGLTVDEAESLNPVVLSICVEVNHNQTKRIDVKKYDDPYILSSKFCQEHDLSPSHRDVIEREISTHLERESKLMQRQQAATAHKEMKTPELRQSKRPATRMPRTLSSNNVSKRKVVAQKQNQKGLNECTFKPRINEVSAILGKNKPTPKDMSRIFEQIQKKEEDFKKQCTFKPKLNDKSRVIVLQSEAKPQKDIFEHLYSAGLNKMKQHKEKTQAPQPECTFKPKINQFSFPERKECKFKAPKEDVDCSFKPKINQLSIPYNPNGVQKWTFISRRQSKSRCRQADTVRTERPARERDDAYFSELAEKIGIKLFRLLDGDGDGVVSGKNMDLEAVPVDVLAAAKVFLQEIQSLDIKVQLSYFVAAFKHFFQRLGLNARAVFISFAQRKEKEETAVKKISQQERNSLLHRMYEQGLQGLQTKRKQAAVESSIRTVNELKECTFKPLIADSIWLS